MAKENVICFYVEHFLEEYETTRCLWNTVHPKFKDRTIGITGIEDMKALPKKLAEFAVHTIQKCEKLIMVKKWTRNAKFICSESFLVPNCR